MTRRAPHPPHPHAPWWLQGGGEQCPHCGQRYHLETERRCSACDAPACPHCAPGDVCPDCVDEKP